MERSAYLIDCSYLKKLTLESRLHRTHSEQRKPWHSNKIKHVHKQRHIREFHITSQRSPKPGTGPWWWPSVTTYSSSASPVCVCARMRRKEEVRRVCLTGGDEIKSGDFPVDCSLQAAACLSLCWRCHYLIHKSVLFIVFPHPSVHSHVPTLPVYSSLHSFIFTQLWFIPSHCKHCLVKSD